MSPTPAPCHPTRPGPAGRFACSCTELDLTMPLEDWTQHVLDRAERCWPNATAELLEGHRIGAYRPPHPEPGQGWFALVECRCTERMRWNNPEAAGAALDALTDWAAHVWAVAVMATPTKAPTIARSCSTCVWSDITDRDGALVLECHLNPPQTLPDPPELPSDVTAELDDARMELEVAYATVHRYPTVEERDWCSQHREEEGSTDGR